MGKTVLRLPASALTAPGPGPLPIERLRDHLAVHFQGVLSRRECAAYARGVYAGRAAWVPNFDGVQFTLGRAYYVHLETDREDEYFDNVEAADAAVERYVPGLVDRLVGMMRLCVGAEIGRRPDFCGPGVHIFPAGEHVSRHGGDVHWDVEGLADEWAAEHLDTLTSVLMLQPAAQGGGLRVWDTVYEDEDSDEAPGSADCEEIVYGVGDLVILDSYRLHQIRPSSGPLDRISVTAHAVRAPVDGGDGGDGGGGGGWQAWF